jgi:hypothetical protein
MPGPPLQAPVQLPVTTNTPTQLTGQQTAGTPSKALLATCAYDAKGNARRARLYLPQAFWPTGGVQVPAIAM